MAKKEYICTNCYKVGIPVNKTPGSILIELVLWLCFLVPGLIYSIYRMVSKKHVCSFCGSNDIVPLDTPRGQELLASHKQ